MSASPDCLPERRCRSRGCEYCGPIRARDEARKFRDNIVHHGGAVILITVTGPGADVLPWDEDVCAHLGPHRHTGPSGCRIRKTWALAWSATAPDGYWRLWDAATESADRLLRRSGWKGAMPRRIACAWAPQLRGIWHTHEALPAGTWAEKLWSRHVVDYLHRRARDYGWGYVDRNPLRHAYKLAGVTSAERVAWYLARNAAGYLADNASTDGYLPGRRLRAYVSRRLTMATGVTMRSIRDAHYLWAIIEKSLPEPQWFTDSVRLERAWNVLSAAPAHAPPV